MEVGRNTLDSVARVTTQLARLAPGPVLRLWSLGARLEAAIRSPRPWIRALLADALPGLDELQQGAAARRLASDKRRRVILCRLLARGYGAVAARTDIARQDLVRLRSGPAVIVDWHTAAYHAVLPALHATGVPLFAITRTPPWPVPPDVTTYHLDEPGGSAGQAVRQALRQLAGGATVVIPADGRGGESKVRIHWLGHEFEVRRGPWALARMGGVPVIPVLPVWNDQGTRIRLVFGPDLQAGTAATPAEVDHILATSCFSWMEERIRESPHLLPTDGGLWLPHIDTE